MATAFDDVKPWPTDGRPDSGYAQGGNNPPLEDRVLDEFSDALSREGLLARIQEITDSAGRVPTIDASNAGKVADLIAMARNAQKGVDALRETRRQSWRHL